MTFDVKKIAFADDLLSEVVNDLLQDASGGGDFHLAESLIILPSARACRTLGHKLLEHSQRKALLLPRVVTPGQLFEEGAAALGLDLDEVPDQATRPLLLAHHMASLTWLKDAPENAPGLAVEFLNVFDEARLYGRTDLLEGEAAVTTVQGAGPEGAAEVLATDTLRIAEVWNLYREWIPRDHIDVQLAVSADTGNRKKYDRLVVAGFGRLDKVQADLIRSFLPHCAKAWLFLPDAESLMSRFMVSTWGSSGNQLDPLAPSRSLLEALCPEKRNVPSEPGRETMRQRLDQLGDLSPLWSPAGPLDAVVCRDQEEESRLVAHRVIEILRQPGGAEKKTAVLTNDPVLAERIIAQLRDAGVDVDNTLGRPLASLPAGVLARFMIRTALTGLRPEPLLEVLTHPDVMVGTVDGVHRERSILNLERMLRSQENLPSGPDGLMKLAQQRDESASAIAGKDIHLMSDFVSSVVAAFQPLLKVASGVKTVAVFLKAMRQSWELLAEEMPLGETKIRPDVTALDRLLDLLHQDQKWLPNNTLAGFAADLSRMMNATNIAPHRTEGLPILVAGLVEARLERYDQVIIAGLNEGKFPTRSNRPLFFDASTRRRLKLPTWRDSLARDAELFTRLLHNGSRVLLTWSKDDGDRPLLPSPLVERLLLGRPGGHDGLEAKDVSLWRRQEVATARITRSQEAFSEESMDVPVLAKARALTHLSWTALRSWRDCPYRFLLERGFALRKSEEVQEEFGRRDVGNIVHKIMHDFLEPGGAGHEALGRGNPSEAEKILGELAQREFAQDGPSLPGRKLWLNSFLGWVPQLVDHEITRFKTWQPVWLEARFQLPLPDLVAWIGRHDPGHPAPTLSDDQQGIVLEGAIDRVDRARDSANSCVVDYKTGRLPTVKQVTALKDLQLLLYSLALESGGMIVDPVAHPVEEAFYYGISGQQIGRPGTAAWSGDRQVLAQAARELFNLACEAAAPEGPFPLLREERNGEGPAQLPCRYCIYRGICRLEERDGLSSDTLVKIDKMVGQKEGGLF